MLRTIIIEDEPDSREVLEQMLTNYCEGIDVIGTAATVKEGIQLIKETLPELVFLDIYMPGGNGFRILDAFSEVFFKVIFVTGYEQFAIKAIKYAALDYILKPVIIDELRTAVEKAKSTPIRSTENLNFLKDKIDDGNDDFDQIILTDYKEHCVIKLDEILFIEAKRSYTLFHLEGDQTRIGSNPLSFYESLLSVRNFFRIHKSYIVNGKKVSKLEGGRGGHVYLKTGSTLPIATRRKTAFIRFLNQAV